MTIKSSNPNEDDIELDYIGEPGSHELEIHAMNVDDTTSEPTNYEIEATITYPGSGFEQLVGKLIHRIF